MHYYTATYRSSHNEHITVLGNDKYASFQAALKAIRLWVGKAVEARIEVLGKMWFRDAPGGASRNVCKLAQVESGPEEGTALIHEDRVVYPITYKAQFDGTWFDAKDNVLWQGTIESDLQFVISEVKFDLVEEADVTNPSTRTV